MGVAVRSELTEIKAKVLEMQAEQQKRLDKQRC
jgi:hypothetical protein